MTHVTFFDKANNVLGDVVLHVKDLDLNGAAFERMIRSRSRPKGTRSWCACNSKGATRQQGMFRVLRRLRSEERELLSALWKEGGEVDDQDRLYDVIRESGLLEAGWVSRHELAGINYLTIPPLALVKGRLRPNKRFVFIYADGSGWREAGSNEKGGA